MQDSDNGGSYAIQGFNYQKSIAMLIAVLHFLGKDRFELSVETDDDIVVTKESGVTYIQAKKTEMNLSKLTAKPKGKDSILEKNLKNGSTADSFKIVTPSYKYLDRDLENIPGKTITQGARVYKYKQNAFDTVEKKLTALSADKLKKSTVAVTLFNENQDEALVTIQGVMTSLGISVDNGHGLRSLDELSRQIDRRSAIIPSDETDELRKTFTKEDLSAIFSNSKKLVHFEDILTKLDYSTAKKEALRDKRITVAALHDYEYTKAKKYIEGLDIVSLNEYEIVSLTMKNSTFKGIESPLEQEAIALDALSQVIYEGKFI